MAIDPFGKSTFGGATSIPGGTAAVDGTAAAGQPMPWKSFDQYFTDKGQLADAQKYGAYQSSYLPSTDSGNWNTPTGQSPYRFAEEYNQYKTTLPQQYQDLIGMGISPEMVQSGKVTGIMGSGGSVTPIQAPAGATYGGTGSQHSLSPDILSKMWK